MFPFFVRIATPLACDVYKLKMQPPPHSSRITFSIDLQNLVSLIRIKSGSFFLICSRTFLRLGSFPIEFALNARILNLVAEFAPPLSVLSYVKLRNDAHNLLDFTIIWKKT